MPNVTINIPDAHFDRVVHALCVDGMDLLGELELQETPENAKRALLARIKETVGRVERMETISLIDTSNINLT